MSQVKKLKKKKTGMSPEAKETLGNAFKGIISNQACVNGGTNGPWWVACIFLVLSIMLPLIPIMVTSSKSYGAAPFASATFSTDRGIYNTFTELEADGYEFKIKGSQMKFYQADVEKEYLSTNPEDSLVATDFLNPTETYKTYNFQVYLSTLRGNQLQELINNISALKYEINSLTPYDPEQVERYKEEGTKFYTPSFLVLNTETMGMAAYKFGTTSMGASTYGGLTWTNTPDYNESTGIDFIKYVLPNASASEKTEVERKQITFNNFRNVLNQTFLEQKNITFRNTTLIYLGIYAGLILFLGLLVFILTRGKKNMFNYLTFFQCQKITWWAAFTPALLGMIFAFIFSTNAIGQMSFVIFIALRVMWMSMRQLRPVQ